MTIDDLVDQANRRCEIARILKTSYFTQKILFKAYRSLDEVRRALAVEKFERRRKDWR